MISYTFQVLVNLKRIKILNSKQASFYQIRVSVYTKTNAKQKSKLAVPFLILNQESSKIKDESSFDIQQNLQQNNAQIDSQSCSFVSKKILVRSIEKFTKLQDSCIFKGHCEYIYGQPLDSDQQKIYICCEVFQLNSFGQQLVAQWTGFTLIKNGSSILPIYFSGYSSSCLIAQFTFLTIQMKLQEDQKVDQLIKKFTLQRRTSLFFFVVRQLIYALISIKKEVLNKDKNKKQITQRIIQKGLKDNQYLQNQVLQMIQNQGKKNSQSGKLRQFQAHVRQLQHMLFTKYLQTNVQQLSRIIYDIWKQFQMLTSKTDSKLQIQQLLNYQRNLDHYHQKYHIIKVNNLYTQQEKNHQLSTQQVQHEITERQIILQQQLVIYPFKEHQISLKISEQDFNKINKFTKTSKPQLIVFIHGYQASSYDMQTISTFIKYKNPKISILLSAINQGRTQQKIQQSGHRLALQIKNHINSKCDIKHLQVSFVCHSMGGLIARASLKYLQLYKNNFGTFLSLCSPHFGYLCHSSALINTSLWVLNKIKKDQSMIELTMKDNQILQKTYLYQLSQRKQIKWFNHAIFLGSKEDDYVPFNSAIVGSKDFYFQTYEAKTHNVLYQNFCKQIQPKIIRLQAVYKDKIKDISSFVGRTAHIKILSNLQIIQLLWLVTKSAF